MASCVVLGHFDYLNPFCIYSTTAMNYFCLEEMNALFFNNELNTKAYYLKQLFKANPQHFLKNTQGRTFVMTRSVIQIARCFNYFYLAELCKLTVDEIIGKVADPLLKCIEYDQWHIASPTPYVMAKQIDLDLKSLNGNEWFLNLPCSFVPRSLNEKQYMKLNRRMSIEEQGKKEYRPITTTTIQLSTVLHQWLSTDSSEHQSGSSMFKTLKSVEKTRLQQQAIIETRQRQAAFTTPNTTLPLSPPTCSDSTRKNGNKKPRLEERVLPPPLTSDHNLRLLASQATQMRGLPISPSLSPQSFLLQPIDQKTKQPLRLPSIQTMLLPMKNMDSCA